MSEKETEYALDILHGILPTIEQMAKDMVGIVRCKDCKYWHGHREYERPMLCHRWKDLTLPTLADDFCSRGERKDG